MMMASAALAQGIANEPAATTEIRSALRSAIKVAMAEQGAAAVAAAAPKVTVTGGIDFPSLYLFRGIRQEFDPKLTIQPFVNFAAAASDQVTLNVGSWNSAHTGSTKDALGAFYESDFYASAVIATGGKVTPTILYTAYTSPNDGFGTVHELAFSAAVASPLAPSFTLAFELGENGADGPQDKGVYLELGLTPAIPMKADSKVSLTVPIKLGLSVKDYYQNPTTGEDSKFGYFSAGLMALGKITPNVDLHGGVLFYGFGDTLKFFNNDESTQVVGTVGIGFSFAR
jgi:hypothetical protein